MIINEINNSILAKYFNVFVILYKLLKYHSVLVKSAQKL